MTTKQMEYIIELAKTKNFNRAAENLFITQPALSYQVRKAEEEIGFDLFIRSGRGAGLTAAGEGFIGTIERILAEYDEAVQKGQSVSPGYAAAIRLGLPDRAAIVGFSEAVEAFAVDNPRVPVEYRRLGKEDYQGDEWQEVDIVFEIKDRSSRRHRGWEEQGLLEGYIEADMAPRAAVRPQDVVVAPEAAMVWVPYLASPVSVSILIKSDEEREIIHNFVSRFVQND
ncbi:MAG: LysR family transcriptional regulator [Lachnospiraceae bacterium]|nr:LysR family transcriptional regulator [Lachnospiraceae bacterium]